MGQSVEKPFITVAVKITEKTNQKPVERLQYLREVDVLKTTRDHPNIINLIDVFENPIQYFMVFEFMPGKDLLNYLKIRHYKINEERAKEIIM